MLDQIDLTKKVDKGVYKAIMPVLEDRLFQVEKASWDAEIPIVILFEGWDASGKGTSIQKLTSSIDPRGYKLYPIRASRTFEKKYPWLWRFWLKIPARGEWAIFDRSWYGRVLVERVHALAAKADWQRAYGEINEFELELTEHQIVVAKFWMAVGEGEQLARFKERDRNPLKRFKVDPEDWRNRKQWRAYQAAARDMIALTSTRHAPWTIVPADDKRQARLAVLTALCDRIEASVD